jgi:hypothetical protein
MKAKYLHFYLVFSLLLIGCGVQEPTDSDDRTETEQRVTSPPSTTEPQATESSPRSQPCQDSFQARELREPYQRHKQNEARYTLSEESYQAYLDLIGIETVCLPPQFGAPFLNVDWNPEAIPTARGRMVSLGFEDLYGGAGWSRGYLLYATYDFAVGSEYDTFARPEDYENVQNGSIPNLIEAGGAKGFMRFHPGLAMGLQTIMKTHIFPFEKYYVAVVINLGAYEPTEVDGILAEMEKGDHPDLFDLDVVRMDELVASLVFR